MVIHDTSYPHGQFKSLLSFLVNLLHHTQYLFGCTTMISNLRPTHIHSTNFRYVHIAIFENRKLYLKRCELRVYRLLKFVCVCFLPLLFRHTYGVFCMTYIHTHAHSRMLHTLNQINISSDNGLQIQVGNWLFLLKLHMFYDYSKFIYWKFGMTMICVHNK